MKYPFFTISIDFELFWGMRDVTTIESYGENILEGRKAIPKILQIFKERNIHATWGVVGFILFENKVELLENLPKTLPNYENTKLNPYHDLKKIGKNEQDDPYHYGYSLIKKISKTKGMEIASHSFSHFYCKEKIGIKLLGAGAGGFIMLTGVKDINLLKKRLLKRSILTFTTSINNKGSIFLQKK